MKGIIFNQLESMVIELHGPEAWEQILTESDLLTKNGIFVGPKTYPDADLMALVGTASRLTSTPANVLVRAFGRYLFPGLARLHPMFLKPEMTAKSFLLSVDRVIHVEVRKLDSGVLLPTIGYEDPAPDKLVLLYRSPRQLCDLAIGLIEGVGEHFNETISHTQPECTKQGAPACRIECTFSPKS